MKKLLTILLAITMVLMSFSAVSAEEDRTYLKTEGVFTLTVDDTKADGYANHAHNLKAYQILKGDLYIPAGEKPILSNIEWGNGVNSTNLVTALKTNSFLGANFANIKSAADFAEVLELHDVYAQLTASIVGANLNETNGKALTKKSDGVFELTGLTPGYYIVVDTPDPSSTTVPVRYITRVVGDVVVDSSVKSQLIPTVSKSVSDTNDSVASTNAEYNRTSFDHNTTMADIYTMGAKNQPSADHDIGDKLVFALRATLPDEKTAGEGEYHGYKQYSAGYKVIFHDTVLSNGFTVKIGEGVPAIPENYFTGDATAKAQKANEWINTEGTKDAIRNNIRVFVDAAGDQSTSREYIAVPKAVYDNLESKYNQTNNNTKYGMTGVSADRLQGVDTDAFYKENCFYYVLGTDENNNTTITVGIDDTMGIALANNNIRVIYNAVLNDKATIGSVGNDNKVYLEYSNNPNTDSVGKTQESLVRVWTYELDITKVTGNVELNGANFIVRKHLADGSVKELEIVYGIGDNSFKYSDFVKKDKNGQDISANSEKYADVETAQAAFDEKIKNNSKFTIIGLDAGNYSIEEITTPNGYNSLPGRIYFKVTADHTENDGMMLKQLSLAITNASFASPVDNSGMAINNNNFASTGVMLTNVNNKKGVQLPTTGGIGTTIFYGAGAILVVGAMIALVVNKKTEK